MALLGEIEAEIRALHRAIADWFNGALPNTDAAFETHLGARIDPGLINIQPSGQALTAPDLLGPMRASHGANPDFRIRIDNVRLIDGGNRPDGPHVALYEEYQTGARNSASENRRISTAIFQRDPATGRLIWRHIHETWLPGDLTDRQ